jgi:WD40 repeat protein
MQFSEDGKRLAVWFNQHAIFDADSGKLVADLDSSGVLDVKAVLRVDHQGRAFATAVDLRKDSRPACLVRFATDGATFETLIADLGRLSTAALSPDGQLLAASVEADSTQKRPWAPTNLEVWKVGTAQQPARLGGHWNQIENIAFSADGKKLATVAHFSDVVKIWSLKDILK